MQIFARTLNATIRSNGIVLKLEAVEGISDTAGCQSISSPKPVLANLLYESIIRVDSRGFGRIKSTQKSRPAQLILFVGLKSHQAEKNELADVIRKRQL